MPNRLLLASLSVSLALAASLASAQGASLDGRAFVADAGIAGKPAEENNEVITFKQGRFHSSACDKYGFTTGEYRAMPASGGVAFETETMSPSDGRIVWKGTIRDDEIEGTFVHHPKGWLFNPDPAPVEHWFKGKTKG